jgi:diguanylate cyclase (GGDEF)-like protein
MKLNFRLLATAAFGVLAVGVTAALCFTLMRVISAKVLDDQGEALQVLAGSTSSMLAEGLYERMREVELLTSAPEVRRSGLDEGLWRPVLDHMQRTRPQFAWIGVTDERGTVKVATGSLLEGQDVSERPWFKRAQQGPYVGDVHPAKLLASKLPLAADGAPMRFVDFAAPVLNAKGELVGVLGVHGAWDWAREVIRTLRSERARDRGILIFITDAQGRVIHHPSGPEGEGEVPRAVGTQHRHRVLAWPDGGQYLTAAARVMPRTPTTDLGWTVIVRQPKAMAMHSADQAAQLTLLAGGIVAFIGVVAAYVLAGRFSAPIEQVSDAARRIGEGDLDAEIPVAERPAELRELGLSLQQMTRALVQQKRGLEDANRGLEERVRERTAELEKASSELARLARRDTLTGLANRRAADERLHQEVALHVRHGQPLSVLLIDIDHFKRVNDTHGHDVGDAVLIEVGQRLGSACRNTDLVARYGGEEFIVVMTHTDEQGALAVAEKLRAEFAAAPWPTVGSLTASIGAACGYGRHTEVAALVKLADEALYQAKRSGRDRVCVARTQAVAGGTTLAASTAASALAG